MTDLLQAEVLRLRADAQALIHRAEELLARFETQNRCSYDSTLAKIIGIVSLHYGFTDQNPVMSQRSRWSQIVWARQVIAFFALELTGLSSKELGRRWGFDHGTILHSRNKVRNLMGSYQSVAQDIDRLRAKIEHSLGAEKNIAT